MDVGASAVDRILQAGGIRPPVPGDEGGAFGSRSPIGVGWLVGLLIGVSSDRRGIIGGFPFPFLYLSFYLLADASVRGVLTLASGVADSSVRTDSSVRGDSRVRGDHVGRAATGPANPADQTARVQRGQLTADGPRVAAAFIGERLHRRPALAAVARMPSQDQQQCQFTTCCTPRLDDALEDLDAHAARSCCSSSTRSANANASTGQSNPCSCARLRTTRYHAAGNTPFLLALLTDDGTTPRAAAIAERPSRRESFCASVIM